MITVRGVPVAYFVFEHIFEISAVNSTGNYFSVTSPDRRLCIMQPFKAADSAVCKNVKILQEVVIKSWVGCFIIIIYDLSRFGVFISYNRMSKLVIDRSTVFLTAFSDSALTVKVLAVISSLPSVRVTVSMSNVFRISFSKVSLRIQIEKVSIRFVNDPFNSSVSHGVVYVSRDIKNCEISSNLVSYVQLLKDLVASQPINSLEKPLSRCFLLCHLFAICHFTKDYYRLPSRYENQLKDLT